MDCFHLAKHVLMVYTHRGEIYNEYMKGALTKFSYNQADALTGHDVRRHKFFPILGTHLRLAQKKKHCW